MRSLLVFGVLVFALTRSPITVAQDTCDRQYVVSQVSLPTTTKLSPSEQAKIGAQVIGRCFDEQQLGELAGRVRVTLQTLGYFRATVSEPTITIGGISRHPSSVSLDFAVVEGARYKVRELIWTGFKALPSEQIVSISQIRPGDIFDTSRLQETVEAVRKLYAANGYPAASIVPQFKVHEAGHWVAVYFSVVEGAQSP